MGAEAVLKSISAMRDEAVAERVAGGDLSGLPDGLTDKEQDLVARVGAELSSEVSGYSATSAAYEALTYIGIEGIPEDLEDEVDEVAGFVFGPAVNPGPGVASMCAKGKGGGGCKACGGKKKFEGTMTFDFAQSPAASRMSPMGAIPPATP
jgi:hypothetical protein